MSFDTLLGNERLKENLLRSIGRGRISHFYLISGPEGSGKHTLAKLLSAAILCQSGEKPCLACNACRKVMGQAHPDCITVDDPEHKTVAVKIVREARADMYIMPNEGSRKIYIFPQELGIEGQNALLKILEEPPDYGVFILLTDNPEKLLPTVRSRCTELALTALPQTLLQKELRNRFPQADGDMIEAAANRSGGFLGQAIALLEAGSDLPPETSAFLEAYAGRSGLRLVQTLVPMEKYKRDQLVAVLQQWLSCLEGALVYRCGMKTATPMAAELTASRSAEDLMEAIRQLQLCIEYAQGNVSPAAICGHLAWALR